MTETGTATEIVTGTVIETAIAAVLLKMTTSEAAEGTTIANAMIATVPAAEEATATSAPAVRSPLIRENHPLDEAPVAAAATSPEAAEGSHPDAIAMTAPALVSTKLVV